MTNVETVGGPVGLDRLGPTLMHEHIFVMRPEALENYGRAWGGLWWDEEVRVADAISKLTRLRDAGVRTIVDPTVLGLGRNIERVQRINAEVDLNIIVATGMYAYLEMPDFLRARTDDVIVDLFCREITEGINGTGVRAAFIKCAVDSPGLAGDVPRILSIVADTATTTTAPVMVHTNAEAQTGVPALNFLVEHGVNPAQVVIAHAGDSNDLDYLRAIADTGACLGFDRCGIEHFNPTPQRVNTLWQLVELGYADRIHLGHDAACFYDFMYANPFFEGENPDYLFVSQQILPQLRGLGVEEAAIEQMMVANPQRFFAPTEITDEPGQAPDKVTF